MSAEVVVGLGLLSDHKWEGGGAHETTSAKMLAALWKCFRSPDPGTFQALKLRD